MGYLSKKELSEMGFAAIGEDVYISDKCSIYNCKNISIGSNVRIDDFCLLSAGEKGIEIGSYVHLSAYSSLVGSEKIILEDFVGVSSKVSIFSSSDDYFGYGLTNPTVPSKYKYVKSRPVILKKHSLVGANSVLLPGARLGVGVSLGALCVVSSKLEEWSIYAGNPLKRVMDRSKAMLDKETDLLIDLQSK